MADRTVKVTLTLNSAQYQSKLGQVARETRSLAIEAERSGSSLRKLLTFTGTATAAVVIGKLIKDSISLEAVYSRTMRQVAVASKAPASALRELDDLAMKLGADTVFSAQDAASAMLELAKGGLSPAQIEAGALKNSLTLAAAGGLELADASNAVVNTMGAFGLEADDTAAAVAALAGAANASTANVGDITQALAQAGTEANSAGLSVQETTAILAAFSNAGIQGSDAGTSLRTMLTRLVPQTKEARTEMARLGLTFTDSNGEFVSAEQIAGRLQKAYKGMSAEERSASLTTVFGADARRAANVLIGEGSSGIRDLVKDTSDLSAAQDLANAGMDGTSGALEQLSGNIETAKIQIGKGLAPVVQDLADKAAQLVGDGDFERWAADGSQGLATFMTELGPALDSLASLGTSALPLVAQGAESFADALQLASEVLNPILKALDALPEGAQQMLVVASAARMLSTRVDGLSLSMDAAGTRSLALKGGLFAAGLGLTSLTSATTSSGSSLNTFGQIASGVALGFAVGGPWGSAIGGAGGLLSALAGQSDLAADAQRRLQAFAAQVAATLDQQTGALTAATEATVAKGLADSGAFDTAQRLGLGLDTVTQAALGNRSAQREVTQAVNDYISANGEFKTITSSAGQQVLALAAQVGTASNSIDRQRKSLNQVGQALMELDGMKATVTVRTVKQTIEETLTAPSKSDPKRSLTDMLRAGGGDVTGPGSGTSDSIVARLSNGEHVLTAAEVKKAGGQDAIYRMRAAIRSGDMPAFASGGAVGGRYDDFSALTRSSKLDLARQQQQIRELEKSLNRGGKGRLRGLSRTVAQLELQQARTDLARMRSENAQLKNYGTPEQEKARQAASEEEEQRIAAAVQIRKQTAEGVMSGADIKAGQTPASVDRMIRRTIADIGSFTSVLSRLKAKNAAPWLLSQMIKLGPSRAVIALGEKYLNDQAALDSINSQASQLDAVSQQYATLTTDERFLAPGAWQSAVVGTQAQQPMVASIVGAEVSVGQDGLMRFVQGQIVVAAADSTMEARFAS